MSKLLSIVLFLLLVGENSIAQNAEKDLISKTWFCNCNFNSDSLILSADNTSNPSCEARFSRNGKLILRHLKKRAIDSTQTYIIRKKNITLHTNLKDSVKTIHYIVKKVAGKKAYMLKVKYSSRYVRRKGDDAIVMDRLILVNGKKRKTIKSEEEIAVFSQNKALRNDSINRAVWGIFAGYIADTLLIDSDQFVEHNFYKKYTDTLHYIAPLLFDTIIRIKVPVKDITGIYCQREPLSSITTNASVIALVAGFVFVTGSIAGGESTVGSVLGQAGVISFLTIPFTFGTAMIFSKQKFQLKSDHKKKKVWKIERHMPGTVITQRGKILNAKK